MSLRTIGSRAIVLGGLTALILLAFGAGIGLAADYQDAKHNVCEGNFTAAGCSEWGKHVTGFENVALGDEMMPALTSGSGNVALGFGALKANTTGQDNLASGFEALRSNTTGQDNIASGFRALVSNTTGESNTASGVEALFSNTTASGNVASGFAALATDTTGANNLASGTLALLNNTTGSFNVALGTDAGGGVTTGSNNIDISNGGVPGESGTTRIGTEGTHTKAFMAGVYPEHLTGCTVQVTSSGQLGCNSAGGNVAVATFASSEKVLSGHCLNYTELEGRGEGTCPAKTSGFSNSNRLAGPTPEGGATPTNLYADANATVNGSDTATVAVIDNTTGATLISCTVTSSTVNHCSNTNESGTAAAGDNIEVKVTASGPSGNNKSWRVRFRY